VFLRAQPPGEYPWGGTGAREGLELRLPLDLSCYKDLRCRGKSTVPRRQVVIRGSHSGDCTLGGAGTSRPMVLAHPSGSYDGEPPSCPM